MSRTHTFAKIALVSVGLLTAIRVAPQLLTCLYMLMREQTMDRFALVMVQIFISIGSLGLLLYVFWVKRDWLAARVVGAEPASELSVPWLPAAYRLVCMAAGLHCLYGLTFQMLGFLLRTSYRSDQLSPAALTAPSVADVMTWAILLAAGLYLCWGAPHFIRWHMKKTLEQCRDITDAG